MIKHQNKSFSKKALNILTITILLFIEFVIRSSIILFLLLYISPVSYLHSSRYEMQEYFNGKISDYDHLMAMQIKPKYGPDIFTDQVLIRCRPRDREYEEIKEDAMILKKDIENYLKEHSDDFSGKEIRVYIAGNDVEIEMKNNTNDEDFYNLEFERFWLNGKDIINEIKEE